jgi:hypothetical protein
MSYLHAKPKGGPAAWSAVLLVVLTMVLTLAVTERVSISGALRPLAQGSTLAPGTATDPGHTGTVDAASLTWPEGRLTSSPHLASHAPGLAGPIARRPSRPDLVVRTPPSGSPTAALGHGDPIARGISRISRALPVSRWLIAERITAPRSTTTDRGG